MVKVKVSEDWIKERREALPAELKALITLQPGRTKTHYLYLKVKSRSEERRVGKESRYLWSPGQ